MPSPRLTYEESCRRLAIYLDGQIPPQVDHLPRHDDDVLGVSFFRTRVSGDLSNLSIPHAFFGRSEIKNAAFRNTDLAESNLCWNDFADVDFSDAALAGSDLRASDFERVRFVRTDLRQADLRHSHFDGCDFDGALMAGAKLTYDQKESVVLSASQVDEIAWCRDPGDEPGGG